MASRKEPADAGHLQQLGGPDGVLLLGGHLLGQVGVAAREAHPGLEHDDDALPEVALLHGVGAIVAQVGQTLLGLGDDAAGAVVEDTGIVHAHQGEAGAQAVAAHGKAAARAAGLVLPGGQDGARLHEGPQPVVLTQALAHGLHQVGVQGVAREALVQAVQLLLVLRGDGVDLALEGLHLVLRPHAVLILHLQAKGLAGPGAAQQIVGLDEDGDVVQHVGVELGAAQQHGLAARLVQGLVGQAEHLHTQGVFVDPKALFHALDSVCHS